MNQTDFSSLLQESITIMKATLIPNILFIPLGLCAIFFNIITFLIILTSKNLRSKCFILLAANAVSDFLLGAGYMSTGSVRVSRHFLGHGELESMFQCFFEVSVIIFAQLLSLGMAAVLVIDRTLATFCPQKYRKW